MYDVDHKGMLTAQAYGANLILIIEHKKTRVMYINKEKNRQQLWLVLIRVLLE